MLLRPRILAVCLLLVPGFLPGGQARGEKVIPEVRVSVPAKVLTAEEIDSLIQQAHELEGNDTKSALESAQASLAGARRLSSLPLELKALLQLGRVQRLLNDYPAALRSAEDGMALARQLHESHALGELFLLRGFIEWNQAKLPEATVSMMEAFRLSESVNDNALRVGALYGRGLLRGRVDDLDGALENLLPALDLAQKTGDERLGLVLNSVGVVYVQRKDYPHAREYLERAVAALRPTTNQRTYAYALLNLGQVATETNDQDTAGRYLDESLVLCERYNFTRGIADIDYLQGARLRRLGRLDEAVQSLDHALEIAGTMDNPDLFVSIYQEYIQTEQARGDYRAALDYTRKLAEKLEIVRGEKSRRIASEIQARYEAEHHARQVETFQRLRDQQTASLAVKNAQLWEVRWLLVSCVLAGCLLGLIINRLRSRARLDRRRLEETRAAKEVVELADARKAELLTAATRNLTESEERFRTAFEHSALGLALVGLDGRWLRVNQALCKVVGYPEEELLARTFQSITHPDDLSADLALLQRLNAGEIDTYSLEKRYFHRQGHIVWIRLDVTMVHDPATGGPGYYISQIHDITERRRSQELLQAAKEEAERANHAKSEFLSRMSHELRTPLNAILGFGQLLGNEDLGLRHNQSVGHINTAGKNLLELINEVLDISQIERGDFKCSLEPTSVEEVLNEAMGYMEPLAREAEVLLHPLPLRPEGEDAPMIRADPRRLKQVLLNLFSNAIKYNHRGGEIRVRCVSQEDHVRVEIIDTGAGIAAESLTQIFTPFLRLGNVDNIQGTGLGLSVSKALTEAMGGTIGAHSILNLGSTFFLEFERLSEGDAAEPELILEDLLPGFYGDLPRADTVLYIEDHADNLELVRHVFADLPGLRLTSANTGQAGLESARARTPDLVLLDLRLPDMTGLEVLRQLRASPGTAEIPVLVLSADASMQQWDALRALGAKDYLVIPFDLKRFRQVVEGVLSAAKAV